VTQPAATSGSGAPAPGPVPIGPAQIGPGQIGIGQIGVARDTGTLRTFLGSCVGLALYDRRRRIAGLAHIVLPDSRGQGTPPGKYADTAVQETIRLIEQLADGGSLTLTAKLAGGAKMFPFQTGPTIGDQNVLAVEQLLAAKGIAIVARACGGEHGRRMAIDVASGIVTIETVGVTPNTIL
jgi:chemotaxis protein CheD